MLSNLTQWDTAVVDSSPVKSTTYHKRKKEIKKSGEIEPTILFLSDAAKIGSRHPSIKKEREKKIVDTWIVA